MRSPVSVSPFLFVLLLCLAPGAHAFNCNVTANGLSFGIYDVFSNVPKDTTGTVTVTCNAPSQNPNAPIPVTISLSPGSSGTFAQRRLQYSGGAETLNYNLFTTPSFSSIWGDGSGGSQVQTGIVTKVAPLNAVIYGRIPARQNVSAGAYSDVITVTIEW